ncbi:MAG: twin-arginine translocase TatA/TatE family subunit [Dehalococcoidia bacterium]
MDIGPPEILLILAIVIIVFGVGKLPEVGSALGKSIREFRTASREDDSMPRLDEPKAEPAAPQPGTVSCSACGTPNAAAARFCMNCGRSMTAAAPPEGTTCSACGAPNIAAVRFCTNCGRPMTPVAGA